MSEPSENRGFVKRINAIDIEGWIRLGVTEPLRLCERLRIVRAALHPREDTALAASAIEDTQRWLERAVIGLNLCPFAKAVHVKQQVRFAITGATTAEQLIEELAQELTLLDQADPAAIETTLLVHPLAMSDFLDFNDFLGLADDLVEVLRANRAYVVNPGKANKRRLKDATKAAEADGGIHRDDPADD